MNSSFRGIYKGTHQNRKLMLQQTGSPGYLFEVLSDKGSNDEGVEYCSELSLAGHSAWRMPSQTGCLDVVDYSCEAHSWPMANKTFEKLVTEDAYLSTISHEDDEEIVWNVDYTYGDSTDVALTSSDGYCIRCVRTVFSHNETIC